MLIEHGVAGPIRWLHGEPALPVHRGRQYAQQSADGGLVANPATQQAVAKSGVYVREGSPDQVSAGWQTTRTTGISHYSNATGVSVDASLMPLTTYPQGGGPNARALLHISGQIVCAQ